MTDITTEAVGQNTDLDSLGPVDYIVVEFPAGASNFTGEMAKELLALVDSGTIRVIDVLMAKVARSRSTLTVTRLAKGGSRARCR
jgi:hypothetical protein